MTSFGFIGSFLSFFKPDTYLKKASPAEKDIKALLDASTKRFVPVGVQGGANEGMCLRQDLNYLDVPLFSLPFVPALLCL